MNRYTDNPLNQEILAEEAGEIIECLGRLIRMKSKISRFGLNDIHPKNRKENVHALEEEIGHFEAMVGILIKQNVLSQERIDVHKQKKLETLEDYYVPLGGLKIETLTCCLCGRDTIGRQWKEVTRGQSICPTCYSWLVRNKTDKQHLDSCYGTYGYHHNISEHPVGGCPNETNQ